MKNQTQLQLIKPNREQNIIEVKGLLQEAFNFRFVQKIARPIDQQKRQELLFKFKKLFTRIHIKLQEIMKEQSDSKESKTAAETYKNDISMKSTKAPTFDIEIKKIQARYIQVFIDGSFKYYPKIAKLLGYPYLSVDYKMHRLKQAVIKMLLSFNY